MNVTKIERIYTGGGNAMWWLTTDDETTAAIGFDGNCYCGYNNQEFTGEADDELWCVKNEGNLEKLIGYSAAVAVKQSIACAMADRDFKLSPTGHNMWVDILNEFCCKANPITGNRPCDDGRLCEKCREQHIVDIYNGRVAEAIAKGGK